MMGYLGAMSYLTSHTETATFLALLLLLAPACGNKDTADTAPPEGDTDTDSDSDSDSDSDADTDADTDADADADADADSDADTDAVAIDLAWTLHEEHESLVYVSWTQQEAGATYVQYGDESEGWLQSPTLDAGEGGHQQLLLGLPYDTVASWQVVVDGHDPAVGDVIVTGDLPEGLPVPSLLVNEPKLQHEAPYLLTSINEDSGGWTSGTYWTFILNRAGQPVWGTSTPRGNWTLFAQVSVTGDHLLIDEATRWSKYDNGASSRIHRWYLTQEFEEHSTPGLHHAFVELPDGTLAWGSKNHGGGEALVTMGPKEKQASVLWTCEEDWPNASYCESNGLFYSTKRDSFLYSFYTNDSLVEVDNATGDTLWWAGEVPDGYAFDPEESQFEWQHGISYTDDETLLVSTRADSDSGSNTTKVIEYEVDHDAQVLTEVWSYDAGAYASTNGDAWRLDNDNTLHVLGSASEIIEVTIDKDVAWHLDYGSTQLLGRGEMIEDLYALVPDQGYQEKSR